MTNNRPRELRYADKVYQRGPNDCWPWTAAHNRFGYGIFRGEDGEQLAHRYGYRIAFGPILREMCVCHSCDNPECQNPAHWFLGSAADNMQDKITKKRHRWGAPRPGVMNANARLSESQVLEIVRLYDAGGVSQDFLANQFGVGQMTVSRIIRGLRWGSVTGRT